MRITSCRVLARLLEAPSADALPTEFCIFQAGANQTSKGVFMFDAVAAESVMAAYVRAGTDVMIDLEHQALCAPDARSDSSDARGWAKLALRPDGSLWAVDVRWTPDGARRLQEKTQRYISPAFNHDDAGVICDLVNCALVAMPATYDAVPLVAATRAPLARDTAAATVLTNRMNPDLLKQALDAIESGDSAKAIEILKGLIVSAASGNDANMPASSAAPDAPPTGEAADPPMASRLCRLLNRATVSEAFQELDSLLARVRALDTETAALESAQRVELVGELVKLGRELPATAWKDPEKRIVCARLAAEPIAELRARVVAYRADPVAPPKPPKAADATALSKSELAACKKAGITPDEYIERKANLVRRIA